MVSATKDAQMSVRLMRSFGKVHMTAVSARGKGKSTSRRFRCQLKINEKPEKFVPNMFALYTCVRQI